MLAAAGAEDRPGPRTLPGVRARPMTEAEFTRCTDPQAILAFLGGRATDRKLRLFGLASIRRVSHLLTDEASWQGVEVLERLADGEGCIEERRQATRNARNAYYKAEHAGGEPRLFAGLGLYRCLVAGKAVVATSEAHLWALRAAHAASDGTDSSEEEQQCRLLRDLFGPLPFQSVSMPAPVLAWDAGCVVKLAAAAYEERNLPEGTLDNGRLAVLADALEEAGLGDQEVLDHLREQGGVHVRGCWVLELILGPDDWPLPRWAGEAEGQAHE